MQSGDSNGYECFEELIRQLHATGHKTMAEKVDEILHNGAWTTGSELLGELGVAIQAFQRASPETGGALQESLNRCLSSVRQVWPDIQ